jgi:tetratricopeptide (TPR) repeat protein
MKMTQDTKRPPQPRQLINQAAKLLAEGNAQMAIPLLERAYEIDTQSVPALINLGAAYTLAGRHREAIPLLETARDLEPQNPMVWVNLGAAYLGNPVLASDKQQLRAISAFETALELDPASPNVHYNLGLIYVDRAEPDLAMAAFCRAADVDPADSDARQWLRRLRADEEGADEHES